MEGDTTTPPPTKPTAPSDRVLCFYCQYDLSGVATTNAAVRQCPECGREEPTLVRKLSTYRTIAFGLTLLAWGLPLYVLCRRLGTFGIMEGATPSNTGSASATMGLKFAPEFRVQIVAASMLLVAAGVGALAAAQPAARLVRRISIVVLAIAAAILFLRLVPIYDQGNDFAPGSSDWVSPRAWDYYSFMLQRVVVAALAGLIGWNLAEVAHTLNMRRVRTLLLTFAAVTAIGYVPWVFSVEAMARSIRIAANTPTPNVINAPLLTSPRLTSPTTPPGARSPVLSSRPPNGDPFWNENAARLVERMEPLMVFLAAAFLWTFVLIFRVQAKVKAEEVVAMARFAPAPPTH